MNIALTLVYFPAGAEPITLHASTNPQLLRTFRETVLQEAQARSTAALGDPAGHLVEIAEEERLRTVLDILLPEEAA